MCLEISKFWRLGRIAALLLGGDQEGATRRLNPSDVIPGW